MSAAIGGVGISIMADLISAQVDVQGTTAFAEQCGVSRSEIERILKERGESVPIGTADDIICKGLARPDLWQSVQDLTEAMERATTKKWVADPRYKAGGYYVQSPMAKAEYDQKRRANGNR